MSRPAHGPRPLTAGTAADDAPSSLSASSPVQRALILAAAARAEDPFADARRDDEIAEDLGLETDEVASLIDEGLDLVARWMYGSRGAVAVPGRALDRDEAVEYLVSRRMVDADLVALARRRRARRPAGRRPAMALERYTHERATRVDEALARPRGADAVADDGAGADAPRPTPSSGEGGSAFARAREIERSGVGETRDLDPPPRLPVVAPSWMSAFDDPGLASMGARARRRAAVGAVVASAALISVVTWFALRELGAPLVLVTAVALGLGLLKAALDWTVVGLYLRRVPWGRVAAMAGFAVALGVVNSDLILATVFRDEVAAEVRTQQVADIRSGTSEEVAARRAAADGDQTSAIVDELTDQVAAAEAVARDARARCDEERTGTGGTGLTGTGPVAQALCSEADVRAQEVVALRTQLDDYRQADLTAAAAVDAEIDDLRDEEAQAIAGLPDPSAFQRLEALGGVVPTTYRIVVAGFLIMIGLAPIALLSLSADRAGPRPTRPLAPWREP